MGSIVRWTLFARRETLFYSFHPFLSELFVLATRKTIGRVWHAGMFWGLSFPNVWPSLMMSAPCLALDLLWIMMLPKRGCFIFLCSLLFAPILRLHSYILLFTARGLPSSLSAPLAILTMSCGPQGGWDALNVKLGGEEGRPRLKQVTLESEALTAFMRMGVTFMQFCHWAVFSFHFWCAHCWVLN